MRSMRAQIGESRAALNASARALDPKNVLSAARRALADVSRRLGRVDPRAVLERERARPERVTERIVTLTHARVHTRAARFRAARRRARRDEPSARARSRATRSPRATGSPYATRARSKRDDLVEVRVHEDASRRASARPWRPRTTTRRPGIDALRPPRRSRRPLEEPRDARRGVSRARARPHYDAVRVREDEIAGGWTLSGEARLAGSTSPSPTSARRSASPTRSTASRGRATRATCSPCAMDGSSPSTPTSRRSRRSSAAGRGRHGDRARQRRGRARRELALESSGRRRLSFAREAAATSRSRRAERARRAMDRASDERRHDGRRPGDVVARRCDSISRPTRSRSTSSTSRARRPSSRPRAPRACAPRTGSGCSPAKAPSRSNSGSAGPRRSTRCSPPFGIAHGGMQSGPLAKMLVQSDDPGQTPRPPCSRARSSRPCRVRRRVAVDARLERVADVPLRARGPADEAEARAVAAVRGAVEAVARAEVRVRRRARVADVLRRRLRALDAIPFVRLGTFGCCCSRCPACTPPSSTRTPLSGELAYAKHASWPRIRSARLRSCRSCTSAGTRCRSWRTARRCRATTGRPGRRRSESPSCRSRAARRQDAHRRRVEVLRREHRARTAREAGAVRRLAVRVGRARLADGAVVRRVTIDSSAPSTVDWTSLPPSWPPSRSSRPCRRTRRPKRKAASMAIAVHGKYIVARHAARHSRIDRPARAKTHRRPDGRRLQHRVRHPGLPRAGRARAAQSHPASRLHAARGDAAPVLGAQRDRLAADGGRAPERRAPRASPSSKRAGGSRGSSRRTSIACTTQPAAATSSSCTARSPTCAAPTAARASRATRLQRPPRRAQPRLSPHATSRSRPTATPSCRRPSIDDVPRAGVPRVRRRAQAGRRLLRRERPARSRARGVRDPRRGRARSSSSARRSRCSPATASSCARPRGASPSPS